MRATSGRRGARLVSLLLMSTSLLTATEPSLDEIVRDDLVFAAAQYERMLDRIADQPGLPRAWEDGRIRLTPPHDWTTGFFPGALWLLYEATGQQRWEEAARRYTALVEPAKHNRGTHDVGFVLFCSFGQGWRLTRDPAYRDVLLEGARSLSTRFNAVVGAIKSWDGHAEWSCPVIVDNLMNLELLTWAGRAGAEPRFALIATAHADTTRRNHFRADASSFHLVDYDATTGAVRGRQTHQGLADGSSWARGQAWGLYGYTMLYRETRQPEYLAQAGRIADFIARHPRLPEDKVPYWDFDAPPGDATPRDASAAAIICSALLELSEFAPAGPAAEYLRLAHQQLRSLSSPRYRAPLGEQGCFLLQHATGHRPQNSEVDVPIIYADYYFLEALLRARRQLAGEPAVRETPR